MSAATKERPTTSHSDEVKAKLKKAGLSQGTEMSPKQVKAVEALPDDASADQVRTAAVSDGKSGTGAKRAAASKYPEPVRVAYKRALDLTGTPDKGGPKYPLTVKQADAIRKALTAKGKSVKDANDGLGNVSDASLRKIAQGKDAPKDQVSAVRNFLKAHAALRDDRTMYARKGAALVLAFREAE